MKYVTIKCLNQETKNVVWEKNFNLEIATEKEEAMNIIEKVVEFATIYYRKNLKNFNNGNYLIDTYDKTYFISIKSLFEFLIEAFKKKYPNEFGEINPTDPYSKSYNDNKLIVEFNGNRYLYRSWYRGNSINGDEIFKSHPEKEGDYIFGVSNYNNGWEILKIS